MSKPRLSTAPILRAAGLIAITLSAPGVCAQTLSGHHGPLVYAVGGLDVREPALNSNRPNGGSRLRFAATKSGGKGGLDLYQATRPNVGTRFGNVTALTTFNTAADESMPHETFDGLEFYFVRRSGCTDSDFYVSKRAAPTAAWGAPVKAGAPFNVKGALYSHPTTSADGLRLYFSMRASCTGLSRAFVTTRSAIGKAWGTPVPFAAVQGPRETGRVVVQNNGQLIWFHGTVLPGGKWGWASTHFDVKTNKWSTPSVLLDLTGVTHLCLDPLTGVMFETHSLNGKLTLFQRFRRVSRLTILGKPPVSGLVINLSVGWSPVVAQYEVDQGSSLRFISFPANNTRRNAVWAVSPALASSALKVPGIQFAFLLNPSVFLMFARTGPSTTGLTELSLTIPKNPTLGGLQLYFQNVMYNATTGAGEFSDPVGFVIAK